MRKQLLLMASATVLLFSCSKNQNTMPSVSTDQQQPKVAGRTSVPFTGSMNYRFTADYDLPCECGSLYVVGNLYGTGNLTHLGATTSKIKPCVSPVYSGDMHIADHVGVECASFVAANGDELYLYTNPYDLVYGMTSAVGHCRVDFVGGTGRFVHATGSFTATVTVPYGSGGATLTDINGTLNY